MNDNVSESESCLNTHTGKLAKVVRLSEDKRSLHVRMENGAIIRLTNAEPLLFKPGNVVIVAENSIELAPDDLWVESSLIGIVRKILDDQLIVEVNYGLRSIPRPSSPELFEGYTIAFHETGEIVSIISEQPIRMRETGFDGEDAAEYYKVKETDKKLTFDDFGGYKDIVDRAKELIETQLSQQKFLEIIRARPVKGIIFSGPPGTGKTLLAQIIAQEANATVYIVSGPSIISKWMGDSEGVLRQIFDDAAKQERAIIFFDEIDSIAEHRQGDSHEASKRLVAQLLTLMDGFHDNGGNVVVIAATNRIQDIDEALLRPGRFDWEIEFGMPSFVDRLDILEVHTKKHEVTGDLPLEEIARRTEGWSPAKLSSLWTEAALVTAGDERKTICDEDLWEALERVGSRPSRLKKTIHHGN